MRSESTDLHPQPPAPSYRPSMSRSRSLRRTALAFAALATISLAACGDDDGGGSTDTTSAPTETTAPTDGAAADEVMVVIKDVAFQTPDVTVPVGGSVTWDNQDNQAHTATGTGTDKFATDTIAPGESKTHHLRRGRQLPVHLLVPPVHEGHRHRRVTRACHSERRAATSAGESPWTRAPLIHPESPHSGAPQPAAPQEERAWRSKRANFAAWPAMSTNGITQPWQRSRKRSAKAIAAC